MMYWTEKDRCNTKVAQMLSKKNKKIFIKGDLKNVKRINKSDARLCIRVQHNN